MTKGCKRFVAAACIGALLAAGGCAQKPPVHRGYKAGVVPGITAAKVEMILGKPSQVQRFSLPGGIGADVMTYPFGQVLLQGGRVVAVTIASDPDYVGPFGIKLGMPEDQVKAAFAAHPKKRNGHRDAYDVVVGQNDTRTRDLYDQSDNLMIELAAANPNDPEAPFNVISISLADDAGLNLLSSITKAKVGGLYPDQHVYNFVTEPWESR